MTPRDKKRAQQIRTAIAAYDANVSKLPGIHGSGCVDSLVAQVIDSLRRIEFVHYVRDSSRLDPRRLDPASLIFDPLRAAVLRNRRGEIDEAWWLVFLATHFGKHEVDGWKLTREVYGKLGQGGLWDWATTSPNPGAFASWLAANGSKIDGRFSNHRKYESLKASSSKGTAAVFASYISWVGHHGNHGGMIREIHLSVGQNPEVVFDTLYKSMKSVQRFGRLGKFDFLTMLGKLGIAPIDPGSAYLIGATGPLCGARLLLGGSVDAPLSAKVLDAELVKFGRNTGLGMQVLEDSLCNWQKSPSQYRRFRG